MFVIIFALSRDEVLSVAPRSAVVIALQVVVMVHDI